MITYQDDSGIRHPSNCDTLAELESLITYERTRASKEHLELVFHVFADRLDDFTTDSQEALDSYHDLMQEEYPAIRLWVELYRNREEDDMELENAVLSIGEYPH